ncbi:MAG: dipeptide epimerase [Planctomycetes bacterium]|nr:dipeptide epimerase [Planctomycetota bacterium]
MKLRTRVVALPLRHRFTIAHGSFAERENFFVELEHAGERGFGESSAVSYYGVDAHAMAARTEVLRPRLEDWDGADPESLWASLLPELDDDRFTLCAIDEAAWDLWGKLRGVRLWEAWGLSLATCPPSDYTIGIDDLDTMVRKLEEFPDFPVYKIKLGTDQDLEIVTELRRHTAAVFRVDANTGWTAEQTIEFAPKLAELGVEFVEQPLPPDDEAGIARVFADSVLPIVADESCLVEADVDRCAGRFHGINVKLTKAGGITPARRMIGRARELGLKTMVGCMTETTVGISAIGQLAPMLDWVDMDGALLLAEDVADGVRVRDGRIEYPDTSGTGVTWTRP